MRPLPLCEWRAFPWPEQFNLRRRSTDAERGREGSGERTRPECWFQRPAETNFDQRGAHKVRRLAMGHREKSAKAGRLRQHSGRARSPEFCFRAFIAAPLLLERLWPYFPAWTRAATFRRNAFSAMKPVASFWL